MSRATNGARTRDPKLGKKVSTIITIWNTTLYILLLFAWYAFGYAITRKHLSQEHYFLFFVGNNLALQSNLFLQHGNALAQHPAIISRSVDRLCSFVVLAVDGVDGGISLHHAAVVHWKLFLGVGLRLTITQPIQVFAKSLGNPCKILQWKAVLKWATKGGRRNTCLNREIFFR